MARVLYVDDSPVARAVVVRMLEARGCSVVVAASLEQAASVDTSNIDVALLDLEVGHESGADLAASLRVERPDLAVAFLTSATDGGPLERARALGPVFEKPGGLERAVDWVAGQAGIE